MVHRWIIEEVFRILKKKGFNIEGSELAQGKAVRKLCLLMLETIIKLFLMQIAYTWKKNGAAAKLFLCAGNRMYGTPDGTTGRKNRKTKEPIHTV